MSTYPIKFKDLEEENKRLKKEAERLGGALLEYGTHGRRSDGIMCEQDKHSNYPCTCGLDQVLKEKNENKNQ